MFFLDLGGGHEIKSNSLFARTNSIGFSASCFLTHLFMLGLAGRRVYNATFLVFLRDYAARFPAVRWLLH